MRLDDTVWTSFNFLPWGYTVQALRDVAEALKKTSWDFDADPCSNSTPWRTPDNNDDAVICNCSFSDSTVCHVTNMYVVQNSLVSLRLLPATYVFPSRSVFKLKTKNVQETANIC